MSTVHTSDLDHAIFAAVHSDAPHADAVQFAVLGRDANGAPLLYRVTAWREGTQFISQAVSPARALERAMRLLKAAAGDGPTRIVEFASIEVEGEVPHA